MGKDTLSIATSDGNPAIVGFGISAYSDSAVAAITAALTQAGLNEEITIPDGCWNILWIVLDEALTDEDTIKFARTGGAPLPAQKYSEHKVSDYKTSLGDNYAAYTGNGHVFWTAGTLENNVPTILQAKTTIFNGTQNRPAVGRITHNGSNVDSRSINCIAVQLAKDGNTTYTSSKSSNFPTVSTENPFLYVEGGKSLVINDFIQANQPGKAFDGYTGEDYNKEDGTFTAPESSNSIFTLTPVFVDKTDYKILISETSNQNGNVTTTPSESAGEGAEVTINVVPNEGYEVNQVSVTTGESVQVSVTPVEGEPNQWTFVMPNGDAMVSVTYTKLLSVTVTESSNGSVNAQPRYPKEGDTITLSITPNHGYELTSLQVKAGEQEIQLTETGYRTRTFVMPDSDVTVTATFGKAEVLTRLDLGVLYDGSGVYANQYEGHYADSDDADAENRMVEEYSLSEPQEAEGAEGKYTKYTVTAKGLRLFANRRPVSETEQAGQDYSSAFGYYLGFVVNSADMRDKTLSIKGAVKDTDGKVTDLVFESGSTPDSRYSPNNEDYKKTLYFQIDQNNLKKEYWFEVTWTWNIGGNPKTQTDKICIVLSEDSSCLPITHTFTVSENMPSGFTGENKTLTAYATTNSDGKMVGYESLPSLDTLGWSFPRDYWTWHWKIDGKYTLEPGKSLAKLGNIGNLGEDDGRIAAFYDHEITIEFDPIPTAAVTATDPANGKITLTPEREDGVYNCGEVVTVKVTPNEGYDVSKLVVGGEDMSTKLVGGEYSFTVTKDVTVTAECYPSDDLVTGVTVNGLTASHTGDKVWSITLPYDQPFPGEGSFKFTTKDGSTAQYISEESSGENTAVYTFTIGDKTYTVVVNGAARRDLAVTVDMQGHGTYTGVGETVKEGVTVNLTLKPGFGYVLPESVKVTVDNRPLSEQNWDFAYDASTGRLTIPGKNVTGIIAVDVKPEFGFISAAIHSEHEEVFYVGQGNTQTFSPSTVWKVPRLRHDEELQEGEVAFDWFKLPANVEYDEDYVNEYGGFEPKSNVFGWQFPEWVTFEGWYVNETEDGEVLPDDPQYYDQYRKLTDLREEVVSAERTDKYYAYVPNEQNPEPVFVAKWNTVGTYSVTVMVLPNADDVKYGKDADPSLAGLPVTNDDPYTFEIKAKVGEDISEEIPQLYYERTGYRISDLNPYTDIDGNSITKIEIQYEEGMENRTNTYVVLIQWIELDYGNTVTMMFVAGEHAAGGMYTSSFTYQEENGVYTPATHQLPDAEECNFEIEEGWEFIGWKIEGDDTLYKDVIDVAELISKYPGGAVFRAQWQPTPLKDIHYTVSPGETGGVTGNTVTLALSKDAEVRTVTLPTTVEGIKAEFTGWSIPENVEFLGWTFGTGLIVNEKKDAGRTEAFRPTEGMSITATWTAKDNVEIWELDYDANGGDDTGENSMPVLVHRVAADDGEAQWRIEIEECTFEPPVGKQFGYWTINGRRVSVNEVVTIRESDLKNGKITVKAVWKDIPDTVVKVYFRDGGGTGFMQSAEVKIAWNEVSRTFTFPSCDYTGTSANPIFAGWKYTVKGVRNGTPFSESDGQIYQPGYEITVNQATADETIISIELVAQWKPKNSGTGGGYVPTPGFGGGTGTGAGAVSATNPVDTPAPAQRPAHGGVATDVDKAASGDTVTVLPDPDNGYITSRVVVTDKNGNPVEVKNNGDGTFSFEMPAGGVNVTAEFMDASDWYIDVADKAWYHDTVAVVSNYGLMTGTGERTFSPNETATRAMLMTILARRNHAPGLNDPDKAWYVPGMEWAVREGVSDGTRPFSPLTREEIITMLYRFVGSPKVNGNKTAAFADANEVDSWAVDAIEWAVETGIMVGREDDKLAPRATATRAELATILTRVIERVKEF